jgi:hypothetical protein
MRLEVLFCTSSILGFFSIDGSGPSLSGDFSDFIIEAFHVTVAAGFGLRDRNWSVANAEASGYQTYLARPPPGCSALGWPWDGTRICFAAICSRSSSWDWNLASHWSMQRMIVGLAWRSGLEVSTAFGVGNISAVFELDVWTTISYPEWSGEENAWQAPRLTVAP